MARAPAPRSVALMSRSLTLKRCGQLLAGAAAINALVFSPLGDQGFFGIVLLGPVLTGLIAGLARRDARVVAATWAFCGLFWLVLDWAVHQEDVAFHAVLALLMAGLTGLGAAIGRAARRAPAPTSV